MRGYAAFMLSVLQWNTIKYRCGEERPAVMLSLNRVHPVSYLSGPADCARAPTHTLAEKDCAEKTTTATQESFNDWGGREYDDSFPGEVAKTALPPG